MSVIRYLSCLQCLTKYLICFIFMSGVLRYSRSMRLEEELAKYAYRVFLSAKICLSCDSVLSGNCSIN